MVYNRRISFILVYVFVLITISSSLFAQCPTIILITSIPNCGVGGCDLCSGESIEINVTGLNFGLGNIMDWYVGLNPDFDPNTRGNLISSSPIISNLSCNPCPMAIGVMANSCFPPGNEYDNEFFWMSSGGGLLVNDLQVDFESQFNVGSNNGDININSGACSFKYPSAFVQGIFGGCSNVHFAGPGDIVPPGAMVIVFTGNLNYDYETFYACDSKLYF